MNYKTQPTMKQLLLIAALALSLVSCSVKNTYRVVSTDNFPHNYTTMIQTTANYNMGQEIQHNGHSFKVIGVQDIEIVAK